MKSSFTIISPFYFLLECLHLQKSPSSCICCECKHLNPISSGKWLWPLCKRRACRLVVCTEPWAGALAFFSQPSRWPDDLLSLAASRKGWFFSFPRSNPGLKGNHVFLRIALGVAFVVLRTPLKGNASVTRNNVRPNMQLFVLYLLINTPSKCSPAAR